MIPEPRTIQMHAGTYIEFQDIRITLPELLFYFRGQEIHLTLTQLRLVMIFLSDPYGHFSSDELVRRMRLPSKQALNVLITNVRILLDQKYIVTLHGFGYAFMVEK